MALGGSVTAMQGAQGRLQPHCIEDTPITKGVKQESGLTHCFQIDVLFFFI